MNTLFRISFLATLILVLPLQSCAQQTMVEKGSYGTMLNTLLSHTVPEVSVTQASEEEEVVFLDARELEEFEVSHIEGAHFVGYDNFEMDAVADIPKDKQVIVYCSVGYRSEKVSEQLIRAGYSNVSNMYGGIFEWKNAGHPVVDSTNVATEKVHAYNRTWGVWLRKGKKVY
ncbi:MAG: rhodanese-like domain-containing protein [Bacteroidota bacterium]